MGPFWPEWARPVLGPARKARGPVRTFFDWALDRAGLGIFIVWAGPARPEKSKKRAGLDQSPMGRP